MDDKIVTVLISGVVSLILGVASFVGSRAALSAERRKIERELQRAMTAKLYDGRMQAYPRALELTEPLRWSAMKSPPDAAALAAVLERLDGWVTTEAGFLLSRTSLQALYGLRRALGERPKDGAFTEEQLKRIWRAKNRFRSALRNDVQFLFGEDGGDPTEEDD